MAMDAGRADAYFVALLNPQLFTRVHSYILFFSGGQGGRVSPSYALWDSMDRTFEDFTVDEAKVCSHDRLQVQGELDAVRVRSVRDRGTLEAHPAGIVRHALAADSDDDDPGAPSETLATDDNDWTGIPTPPCMRP